MRGYVIRWAGLLSIAPIIALACLLMPHAAVANSDSGFAHMDPEMSGTEYRNILQGQKSLKTGVLDPILQMGARNLDWLKHINSLRDDNHKIGFSSASSQTGIPIDAPVQYNQAIVLADYAKLLNELPPAIKAVLVGDQAPTDNPPMDDDTYIKWGRKADRVYSYASRWLMMQSWLAQLQQRRWMDVRGYYFLTREPDLQKKLQNWSAQTAADQARLRPLLAGLCANANIDLATCKNTVKAAEGSGKLWAFYSQYLPQGQQVWNQFFSIDIRRSDITWSTNPEQLTLPFLDPQNADTKSFLLNIEDEWHWSPWQLLLNFTNAAAAGATPHIIFQAGATPHVNAVGGNEITMDANEPLSEYTVQWTIRHEFGHVLGFKDCYVEFYDADAAAIVTYQLDITNLMCSRKGKLQEQHFRELQRLCAHIRKPDIMIPA